MTENLVLLCLVLMVIEQGLGIWMNRTTTLSNQRRYEAAMKALEDKLRQVVRERDHWVEMVNRMSAELKAKDCQNDVKG